MVAELFSGLVSVWLISSQMAVRAEILPPSGLPGVPGGVLTNGSGMSHEWGQNGGMLHSAIGAPASRGNVDLRLGTTALAASHGRVVQESTCGSGCSCEDKETLASYGSTSYRKQVEEALRRWVSVSPEESVRAAENLLALYAQIAQDASVPPREKRALLRRLEIRLGRLKDQLRQKLRPSSGRDSDHNPSWEGQVETSEDKGLKDSRLSASPVDGEGYGGMAASFGGPVGPPDYAAALIELIEQVVKPQSWAVNGGMGQIFYWRPGHALVIRQTDEVHREVAQLLDLLRRVK